MGEPVKKLVLIDGNAIMHRAYHALPPLNTKKGELVNAVYGFASTLLSVIDTIKPDYIAASFDLAGPTFRHEEYKDYKATRAKAPDEFYQQIPRVKEFVKAFSIPIYEKEGYEADDVIGTLARQAEENEDEDVEVLIVTGDLDTLQLVDKKTKVYTMRKGISDSVIYDEEKVRERYNLDPIQIIDYKGLRGDPSDNIPGVKGIGEKTASELLAEYGTIEKIYHNISKIKGSVKEKLERDRLKAFMSKKLATISTNVPVNLNLEKTKTHDFDRTKLVNLFKELNFFSLIKRIPQNSDSSAYGRDDMNGSAEIKDFKYKEIDEKNQNEFWKNLEEQKEIALALDVLGESTKPEIRGIAFSWKAGRAFYLKYSKEIFDRLKKVLEDEKVRKIGYDLKSVLKALNFYQIKLKGIYFDDMIAAYLLDPGSRTEFSKLVLVELGEEIFEEDKKAGQLSMVASEDARKKETENLCQKADYIHKLKKILSGKIISIGKEQDEEGHIEGNIQKLFFDVEMPLVEILSGMEASGVKLNSMVLEGISKKIEEKIKNLEGSIYKLSGSRFNINSPQQLAEALFEKMKLPTTDIKKLKNGFSTASSELDKLHSKHKIIDKIEEYREIFKLKTTYLDTLPTLVDEDSRLHTTFNQTITATGRLSSSDPNLQNIPIRTDLGQLMRTAFVAEDGWRLVSGDYSQIDLRIVAHVSDDKKLIEAFIRGDDIHKITAAEINKVSLSQVTDKMRRAAKALNFGVIYGMSVFGFAQASGVERDDAKKFINEYMKKFSGVANYIIRTKESAKRNGYVETLLGRRRNIPEINSPNFQVAQGAERMAINMPIQGLAADIVKISMVKIFEEYKDNPNVRMILQIHDEIILEVKENIAEKVSKRVKEIMEGVFKLKVPLVADVNTGDNWGEL